MYVHNGRSAKAASRVALVSIAIAFAQASSVASAQDGLVTYKSLSPDLALEVAQAALKRCRADGFQVAVVVMDRFGQAQVLIRDQYAGLPAAETASDKAYTAIGFRANTSDLVKSVQSGQLSATLGTLPRVRFLAGGLMIESAGTLVGSVGVSGAPGGDKDEACAQAGLDAIRDKLDF
ncbi:MAG: heme-binding protein [Variibacter sp.]